MSPLCGQGRVHPCALSSCFATRSTAAGSELAELAEFQLSHLLAVPGGVSALSWESRREGGGQKGDMKQRLLDTAAAALPRHSASCLWGLPGHGSPAPLGVWGAPLDSFPSGSECSTLCHSLPTSLQLFG